MAEPTTLTRVRRVAPFAAVAVLGLGVLIVPEPDRSAADSSPADPVAIAPAGAALAEIAIAEPEPVASPPISLPPPRPPAPVVATATAVPRTTTTVRTKAPEPLRMSAFGWSSATGAGTTAGTAGIPEDSLPVGAGPSGPDKVSWFRLAGTVATLVLHPVPDAGANRFDADATIRLCRSTVADWATGANLEAAETPPVDDSRCSDGERADDGSWSFDLAPLGDVEDRRGVVLVPGDGLFQITFAQQGET